MPSISIVLNRSSLITVAMWFLAVGLGCFILLFPLGISLREITAVIAGVGLISFLILDDQTSHLNIFPLKWVCFLFLGFMVFKTVHSIEPSFGMYALRTNAHKAFLLFVVGIEALRTPIQLRHLVFLFVIMGCYEGLDGVYQSIVGVDLIKGDPLIGQRLTGSLSSARVGNLMALVLPITFALPSALASSRSRLVNLLLIATVCVPQLYLLIGSRTRSGFVGLAVALGSYLLIKKVRKAWPIIGASCLVGSVFMLSGLGRMSIQGLLTDNRIRDVWPIAWGVFQEYPLLGSGLNTFDKAYKLLGFVPQHMDGALGHPHNIYLQFLCETGCIGFVVLLSFLGGIALWTGRRIRAGFRHSPYSRHWTMAAAFWSSYMGYLATAFSAHNFFRSWWLGMAMTILGITIGACLHGDPEAKDGRLS